MLDLTINELFMLQDLLNDHLNDITSEMTIQTGLHPNDHGQLFSDRHAAWLEKVAALSADKDSCTILLAKVTQDVNSRLSSISRRSSTRHQTCCF